MIATATIPTPLGPLTAYATPRGLAAVDFPHRTTSFAPFQHSATDGPNPHLDRCATELAAYFAGDLTAFTVPLDLHGTPFQTRVWHALLDIPLGETRTYANIASAIASPAAVRAVGLANGANKIAIIVPCHRVIGANGNLTGYGGGLDRKRWLLHHEHANIGEPSFFA